MGEYEWNEPAGPKCIRASPAALGLHSAGRGALGYLRHRSAMLVSIRPPAWWGGVSGEGRVPPDSTAIIASTVFTDAPKPKAPPLRRADPTRVTKQTRHPSKKLACNICIRLAYVRVRRINDNQKNILIWPISHKF